MAEERDLRIRVACETGAAQDALGALSDVQAGLAKATEKTGTETQKLARQTAEATAAARAATEATTRASRAQAEADAVVRAFGEDSLEAAEAQARLKAAQEAATKATRDAERALEGAAKAVAEAGKSADAKAAPGINRMATALQRAGKDAERTAQDLRTLEARIAAADKAARTGGGAVSGMFDKVAGGLAAAFAFDKIKDGIRWAAEHNEQFGESFALLNAEATQLGENFLSGPIGQGLASAMRGLALAVDKTGEWVARLKSVGDALPAFDAIEKAVDRTKAAARPDAEWVSSLASFTETLIVEARSHLAAAEAATKHHEALAGLVQSVSDDALWRKLEMRTAQAEAAAIEAAFFDENQIGPRLKDGKFTAPERKSGGKREDLAASSVSRGFDGSAFSDVLAVDAEIAGLDRLALAREARIEALAREQEIIEAAGADATRIIEARLDAEVSLARWQEQNAITHAQRDAARTRREQAEHQKRIAATRKAVADEAKEMERRERVIAMVTGAVTQLGETMVEGIDRMVQGERGAIAHALADTLKAVAKKNAILALEQGALAVAAAASYNYPKAAEHGVAAGLHAGVAAAAGVGAVAAGKVWEANREPSGGGGGGGGSGGGTGARGGSSGGGSSDGLGAQDVPVSHGGLGPAAGAGMGGGVVVNIYNPTIAGAGGVREFAATIRAEIERSNRGGPRPRN